MAELNMQKVLADLDAVHATTQAQLAEVSKLNAETNKLVAERGLLEASDRKMQRETYWYPLIALTGAFAAGVGVVFLVLRLAQTLL